MNEIEIGLDFVNERCNTSYTNPEDVIVAGEQLAAEEACMGKSPLPTYMVLADIAEEYGLI